MPVAYDNDDDILDIFPDEPVADSRSLSEAQLVDREKSLAKIELKKCIREWVKWKINWREYLGTYLRIGILIFCMT